MTLRARARAGLAASALWLAAACGGGGGTPTGAGVLPGTASEPPPEPPAEVDSEVVRPESSEPAAPPPGRPPETDVTVTVEMTQILLPCVLLAPDGLPFSTYLFEDFQQEAVDSATVDHGDTADVFFLGTYLVQRSG